MANTLYEIDFYQEFPLERPVSGLVKRITSPRGKRSREGDKVVYRLNTELKDIYKKEPTIVEPGIYQVSCICKPYGAISFNQYLFVVEDDGETYPVAEYLDTEDSGWVVGAIDVVKRYFSGKKIKPISLTIYNKDETDKKSWTRGTK